MTRNDQELGKIVLSRFNFHMLRINSKSYTAEQLAAANRYTVENFLDGLGFQYFTIDKDFAKMDAAMLNLAKISGGKIPNFMSFSNAFTKSAGTYTFKEAFIAVSKETAKELGNQAKAIGDNVLTALKIAPFLFLAGAVVYGYFLIKPILKKDE
jgi:hypothetical protein